MSVQDVNRLGAQDANERPLYTALLTGYQIGILRGARSIQLRGCFINQLFKIFIVSGVVINPHPEVYTYMGKAAGFKPELDKLESLRLYQ
jgi:hypothetical protein